MYNKHVPYNERENRGYKRTNAAQGQIFLINIVTDRKRGGIMILLNTANPVANRYLNTLCMLMLMSGFEGNILYEM